MLNSWSVAFLYVIDVCHLRHTGSAAYRTDLWDWHIINWVDYLTLILRCLHWLKITECIKYKFLSLTYKVLTTTKSPYLYLQ